MKKIATVMIIVLISVISGCGEEKHIEGTTYGTYGFINAGEMKNPDIKYELITGNIVWGVILCETIVAPIYFFGFSLYQPVRVKSEGEPKGSI